MNPSRHRIGAALFETCDGLVLHHLEFAIGKAGVTQNISKDVQTGCQVLTLGLDRKCCLAQADAAKHATHSEHAGAESHDVFVENILYLLPGEVFGAAESSIRAGSRRPRRTLRKLSASP